MKRSIFFVLIALCLLIATPLFAGTQSRGQVLYQPALYNDLSSATITSWGNTRLIFRNTADETITLVRVDFYGPAGTRLYQYLTGPIDIGPFQSITYLASESVLGFTRGSGSGGRYFFMVEWESDVRVMPPIVEAARAIITLGIGVVAQSITPAIVIEKSGK